MAGLNSSSRYLVIAGSCMQLEKAQNRLKRMEIEKVFLILFTFVLIAVFGDKVMACSMYKITVDGKTMVGCNHDTWFSTPKIWFENAREQNEFGACFTGARQVGGSNTAPQSGMNEKGLVLVLTYSHEMIRYFRI